LVCKHTFINSAARFARRQDFKILSYFFVLTQKSSKKVKPDEIFAAKLRLFFATQYKPLCSCIAYLSLRYKNRLVCYAKISKGIFLVC
jgi:hypothetical protein